MHLLKFKIADKEYAADIAVVREVLRMRDIVPIPKSPSFVEGVFSLRGHVVPAINIRKKLGLQDTGLLKSNRIIVSDIGNHLVGFIVDSVVGVKQEEAEKIEPPDEVVKDVEYLKGIVRTKDSISLILDMARLLSKKDRDVISVVESKVTVKKKDE